MKKITIKIANTKRNKFGARKYAWVASETTKGNFYLVLKIRKRDKKHYKYVCSCMNNMNTQQRCKHIKKFIKAEQATGLKASL